MNLSSVVTFNGECPWCTSSDAYFEFDDGHTKCHSCEHFTPPTNYKKKKSVKEKKPITPIPDSFTAISDRGISAEAAARYQITFVEDTEDIFVHHYPYFKGGKHLANKSRIRAEKDFRVQGPINECDLFGMQAFPAGCAPAITLVEGELDAAAAYDMNGGFPVVSVKSASQAVDNVRQNFDYLNSFDEIVICFDKDDAKVNKKTGEIRYPGQEAAIKVAEILPMGKVRILTLREHKDPNDYLQANKKRLFQREWYDAPKFTPTSLKTGADLWDEVINVPEYETVSYPFSGLQEKTYGIRLSEMVIINAPQKIGKSTLLGEITYHLLKETEAGIGIMRLEESNRDTALNLMSLDAGKRLHLPDVWDECTEDEIRGYYDATVNTDRLVIWDHFGSNSIDAVLAQIRNMVALGCKYVILDHLSIIVSDQSGDERKQLDELATKLKTLCMELNISLIAVVHQNREGQIRGTAGIGQLANIVIRLDRDKESRDDFVRNCTEVVITDNRFCGDTGLACYLFYDTGTGRMEAMDEESYVARKRNSGPDFDNEEWVDLIEEEEDVD